MLEHLGIEIAAVGQRGATEHWQLLFVNHDQSLECEIHTSASTPPSCPCSSPACVRQLGPIAILQLQAGCSAIPL